MMPSRDSRRSTRTNGFTIPELLTVVVILIILSGVSIAGYGQWQKKIAASEVQSDLNGIAAAMESERNFSNAYPLALPSTFTASPRVTLTYRSGTTQTYCIDAVSTKEPTVMYYLNSAGGNDKPAPGTC